MEGNNLAGPIQLRLFLWSLKIHFTLQTAVCRIIFPESHRLEWQNLNAVCSVYIVISPSFCNDKPLSPFFSGKTLFSLSRFNCLCVLKCPQMFSQPFTVICLQQTVQLISEIDCVVALCLVLARLHAVENCSDSPQIFPADTHQPQISSDFIADTAAFPQKYLYI